MTIAVASESLQHRIDSALAQISRAHLAQSMQDEIVNDLEVGARRLQNYAFSQGFCMMIAKHDKKRERMIMNVVDIRRLHEISET